MSMFGFVPVTIDVRDELLLPVDGAAIAPTTQLVISGTRLRGVLAQVVMATDKTLIDPLIASGDVAVGAAFPLVDSLGLVGYPAPVTAVVSDRRPDAAEGDRDGQEFVLDERGPLPRMAKLQRLSGLVAHRRQEWTPVVVETVTTQRLVRRRAGGSQEGLGPITFTTIAAQQRFRALFRLRGTPERRKDLASKVADLLDGQVVTMGSAEQSGYGGDPLFTVGAMVDGPADLPAESLLQSATELDIVLRTPALVTDPSTGFYAPDAIDMHIQQLIEDAGISGKVTGSSVRRVAVAGATVGYGRRRPQQWAAAAGSVVRVRLEAPSTAWADVVSRRLGHRTVDGFGTFGVDLPDPAGRATLQPSQRPSVHAPQGTVVLAGGPPQAVTDTAMLTGLAAAQYGLLQNRLYQDATELWRTKAAGAVWPALQGVSTVPASAWGRLRQAASTPAALAELLSKLKTTDKHSDTVRRTDETGWSPLAEHFKSARMGSVALTDWFYAAASGDAATLWSPPAMQQQQRAWIEDLKAVCLEQQPPMPKTSRPPQSVLTWAQQHLLSEGLLIARAVIHTAQQAATS